MSSGIKKILIKRKETENKQISTNEYHEEKELENIEEPKQGKKITKYERLKNKTEQYNSELSNIMMKIQMKM